MTYDEIPVLYRNTWAMYDALRRLGFADDQISHLATKVVTRAGPNPEGEHIVVILTVGDKMCTFVAGPIDRPFEEARELIRRMRAAIADKSIDDATLRRLWKTSALGKIENFETIARVVLSKGIPIPVFVN